MHFKKYPHPANFEFARFQSLNSEFLTSKGTYHIHAQSVAEDIYHIQITGDKWNSNDSQADLILPNASNEREESHTRLTLTNTGQVLLIAENGEEILSTREDHFFGQNGEASIFEFKRQDGDQFYGLGEKWTGFEHSGKTTKFWNTDVWADFPSHNIIHGNPDPDPVYVAIPYLILKRAQTYVGLLLDNPHAAYVSTAPQVTISNQKTLSDTQSDTFHIGAEQGQPNLYIIYGPSLLELTCKFQKLVGVTPRPPAWALGYHQCRWGYQSERDLHELDALFRKHGIPVDGLWLDIDYMEDYKVFTFASENFSDPPKAISKLAESGRHVVPIIDPGVKQEPGYCVYERGKSVKAFCKNPQGLDYVGMVWPGKTVFPDFSLEQVRCWWANEVRQFAQSGIDGAWLDMNDPSTGSVENCDMLFDNGQKSHSTFHNQYALGMAKATRQGFLDARPSIRPFLLCRSGSIGSGQHTAIWTGDNYSNYHHLKNSIAATLNLALSGVPFNGPDVGGFAGDTSEQLILDWFKAAFLFPLFRNHTMEGSRQQEPWAFGNELLPVLRRYIQLRYRLRPYLYQLFIRQEATGDAILRPLFYDFEDTASLPLGLADDQFMVGPQIMQAPFVSESRQRSVLLPGTQAWYSPMEGKWIRGGQKISVEAGLETTPIYIRDHSILPLARLEPHLNVFHGEHIDFHMYLSGDGECTERYGFDDGITFNYRNGERSETAILARRNGNSISVQTFAIKEGCGRGSFTFTTEQCIHRLTINGAEAKAVAAQGIPFGNAETLTWSIEPDL
ncbi:MAG: TIM-barrel domain-containing protein [Chthoniobacteraceae bacterium]